jgi:hypothetical protein
MDGAHPPEGRDEPEPAGRVLALAEAGNPAEVIVEPKEGHGFYDEKARERMYTRLLEFLRANTSPAPSRKGD